MKKDKKKKEKTKRFNLAKKIILLIAVLILIVSMGIGGLGLKFSSDAIIGEVEKALLQFAEEGVSYVESVIDKELSVLQELANREELKSMDWETQYTSLKSDVERLGYLDMAIVSKSGMAQYILSGETAGLGDREYIIKAFEGEANVSNVIISRIDKKPVVMFAVPIKKGDEIVGVLAGRRDATALCDITDNMGFGENGYAFILGKDGTTYAHPNREDVMNRANALKDIESGGELKTFGLAVQEVGIGNKGVANYEVQGSRRYVGLAPMPSTGWMIGVGAYESDVLAGLNSLRRVVIIGTIVFMILGILVAAYMGSSISKPIIELSKEIGEMSNYDLKIEEDSAAVKYRERKDEIGDIANALLTMQNNLVDLVKNIANSSEQVAASSEELTATSQQSAIAADEIAKVIEDIAIGANDQARDTEKGALNIEELGKQIAENREKIEALNDATEEMNVLKNEGLEIVKDLVEKTETNREAAESIREIILETNESSEKIEDASLMIKNIAEQTNLLALNAAIEAARAGESGRGFAVVAEEIRKLAEESNKFTEEIAEVIKELINKTEHSVSTMEKVNEITKSQAESVKMTTDKFEGIAVSIDKERELIRAVYEIGNEMEVKKNEIISVIQNLSAISEENAAGTEEASASVEEQTASMEEIANASEALAQLATELQESIAQFKY